MPTQEVLIDIQINDADLDSTLAKLEQFGKIDPQLANSFRQTQASTKTASTEVKGLVKTFHDVKSSATIMGKSVKDAFNQGVNDALKKAGVTAEQFEAALKKAASGPVSLRQELKLLTEQIALAKVNGTDLGAEFENMKKRAGELKDAIGDASKDIANMGSDTRGIDNVIGSVNALAGGFSIMTGVSALAGKESEDLQKALLKVNGVMAISQGIQQVSNALQKEGSLVKLADATATGFQTAAQRIYTAVTGKATAATIGFKAALIATGIGAVVLLVLSLVEAFSSLSSEADDARTSMDQFNLSIERSQIGLSNQVVAVRQHTDKLIQYAKLRGATEDELNKIKVQGDKYVTESYTKFIDKQISDARRVGKQYGITIQDIVKNAGDARTVIETLENILASPIVRSDSQKEAIKTTIDNFKTIEGNFRESQNEQTKTEIDQLEFRNAQRDKDIEKQKKAAEKAKADRLKKEQEERDALERKLADELAAIERRLLKTKEGSQEEINIQKEIIAKKAEIELSAEKLGENQKALIREKSFKDQLNLQLEFNKRLTAEQIQAQIDRNNAELSNLQLNEGAKLRLTVENLHAIAQLEIDSAKGNSAKILSIKAKLFADEKALFRASLQKISDDEIALTEARFFKAKTAMQDLAANEKATAEQRISAIRSIEQADLNSIDKRMGLLEQFNELGIISATDFNLEYQNLLNKKYEITRDAEGKITGITLSEADKRQSELEEDFRQIADIANRSIDLISSVNQMATDTERNRIDQAKKELQSLEEAGAITQKQAEIRAKQIEIQERQLRIKQAQREKQSAIFKALLGIPQAFIEGLKTGIPGLQFVYAAMAAAQLVLIAARPIPKFAKGKKDSYEGLGLVGEAGAELIERNGRMYITEKPTITYIGKADKIYTHRETKKILSDKVNIKNEKLTTTFYNNSKIYSFESVKTILPKIEKVPSHNTMKIPAAKSEQGIKIDYEKLAKIMEKNKSNTSINIDKDFISESVKDGLMKTNYYNNRYRF